MTAKSLSCIMGLGRVELPTSRLSGDMVESTFHAPQRFRAHAKPLSFAKNPQNFRETRNPGVSRESKRALYTRRR